jgi:ATP-dependent helicase/nuclease subunit B
VNRLVNLMEGLPAQRGPEALALMRRRGAEWLDLAARLDRPARRVPPEPRPSPAPPPAQRPRELPVTAISKLIRDPYAIYARYVLKLRPLDPLRPEPDAAERGSVLHAILEAYVREGADPPRLMPLARDLLQAEVPWPAARRLWLARLARVSRWFLAQEALRKGQPVLIEKGGGIAVEPFGFRLTAKPDRIDLLPDGRVEILDYKTGTPPTASQQRSFDKQLLLEVAMAERGAFGQLGPVEVAQALYIGLGSAPKVVPVDLPPGAGARVWEEFRLLLQSYADPERGYTSRRAMMLTSDKSDYDHLSRFGEWDVTDPPVLLPVGREAAP